MIRRFLTATALVAGVSLPTQAQELAPEPAPAGTQDGASALRASLATYFTEVPFEKGILRIEPDPAGQRIILDPRPLLKNVLEIDVETSPMAFLVSPRSDGDWNVFSRDPIRMKFDATIGEQAQSFEYSQGEQVFKGVYAPDLFAYRSAEGVARDTLSVQSDPLTDTTTSIAVNKLSMTAKPGAEGGVDIAVRQTLTDVGQSVGVKPLPPTEGESQEDAESRALFHSMLSSVGLKASEVDTVASAAGLRNVEAVELYRLVLKNADAIAADHKAALAGPFGEELRAALLKILPIWSAFDVAWTARDASFQSSFATLRVAETKQSTRMTGLARDARLDSDISFEGFSLEGPFLQPWAARFIPKAGEFGVAISGIDLATPADLALRKVDFTADEPFSEEVKAELLKSFAPNNITITLKPSVVRATDLDLNLSGELHFVDEKPEGTLTARASGLDRTIESLQRAAEKEPDLFQVVGMVQMAQGLGRKTDAGDWEWVVEAAADGSVSVNGNMLKGPDPEIDPEALSDDDMGADVEPDAGTDTDAAPSTDAGAAGEGGQQ